MDEAWKHYSENSTILDFISGPVNQFFLNQKHFELTGKWLNGERGHGAKGIVEYYQEELQTLDVEAIINLVRYLTHKKIKGHWTCYCRSGKKLRDCHLEKLKALHGKISRDIAERSLAGLTRRQLTNPSH